MFSGRIRQRSSYCGLQTDIPGYVYIGEEFVLNTTTGQWSPAGKVNIGYATSLIKVRQELCMDELHPGPPYLTGGGLSIIHWDNWKYDLRHVGSYISPNGKYRYDGGFLCSGPGVLTPYTTAFGNSFWDNTQHTAYDVALSNGATGWNRARPGQPTAGLAQFLGEAKDLPRMLRTTARGFKDAWNSVFGRKVPSTRDYAEQWLNHQFGWLPFVSDVRRLYNTYKNLDKEIARVKTNNGKWLRRRCSLSGGEETTALSYSNVTSHRPVLNTYYSLGIPFDQIGSTTVNARTVTTNWFEGCFRYFIPDIDSPEWEKRAVYSLFGLRPNASLIWELTPWSWLADWFTNIGDVISNLDNNLAENLVAKYAYSMTTREQYVDVSSTYNTNIFSLSDTWSYGVTTKGRAAVGPFGVASSWDSLSPRQWSILSALGISRLG